MLQATLTFFILALIAALFGFGVISSAFASLAKIAFFLFLVLAALSLVGNFLRGVDRAV